MRWAPIGCALGFAASIVLSFLHPWGDPRSGTHPDAALMEAAAAPENVRHLLEEKCGDCHSEKTSWPLYSRVAPLSWLIEKDVIDGRGRLNMSAWPRYSTESQIDLLTRMASEARSGEMPLKRYLLLHPEANMSTAERQLIYDWAKVERRRMRAIAHAQPGPPIASQRTSKP